MSYIDGPRRPGWFRPIAITWVLTGLPAALIVPYVWLTGASLTEAPPPPAPVGTTSYFLEISTRLIAMAWTFGTPIALFVVDRKHRKLLRQSDL